MKLKSNKNNIKSSSSDANIKIVKSSWSLGRYTTERTIGFFVHFKCGE